MRYAFARINWKVPVPTVEDQASTDSLLTDRALFFFGGHEYVYLLEIKICSYVHRVPQENSR